MLLGHTLPQFLLETLVLHLTLQLMMTTFWKIVKHLQLMLTHPHYLLVLLLVALDKLQ